MAKRGPKIKAVDWHKVDAMCKIQCTEVEICSILEMCEDTLNQRCKEDKGMKFSEYSAIKREGGKASLRRTQWLHAEKNPAMAIFLGKNILGQSDRQAIDHTTGGKELKNLTTEERQSKILQLQKSLDVD